jgi:hypothetical protein
MGLSGNTRGFATHRASVPQELNRVSESVQASDDDPFPRERFAVPKTVWIRIAARRNRVAFAPRFIETTLEHEALPPQCCARIRIVAAYLRTVQEFQTFANMPVGKGILR